MDTVPSSTPLADAAAAFLALRRIAVTGVSRSADGHGGNTVYKRLRERGYEVFAVNPNATEVEGDPAYPSISAIPGGVDGVVVAARPETAAAAIAECVDLGVGQVWMHRAFGPGSVDPEAAAEGRRHGLTVIEGGCPLMFGETSDLAHRLIRRVCLRSGAAPRTVEIAVAGG